MMKSDKWWQKEPRSRRKCYRCKHLYSSHIDVACMKIITLKPERKGCSCRGFIADENELNFALQRQKNKLQKLNISSNKKTKENFPNFPKKRSMLL